MISNRGGNIQEFRYIVYLFFMSGILTLLLKKKFEEVLPSAIMLSSLTLYLTVFVGKLSIGFYLVILVAFCFSITLIIEKYEEKVVTSIVFDVA